MVAEVPRPEPELGDRAFQTCAVDLITRWEVGSPALYTRKWQGVIWPGGASGPTWGVGYDGGHQTRLDIVRDWEAHPNRTDLASTSGLIGIAAKQRLGEWRHVRTPFPYATDVFVAVSLPSYTSMARRAFGPGFVSLPASTRCGLVSVVYNRGGQTTGARRAEYRTIRDVCVPAGDSACIAAQIRAMKRLWPGNTGPDRGLRLRRDDEARVIEGDVRATAQAPQLERERQPQRIPTPNARPGRSPTAPTPRLRQLFTAS